MKYMKSKYISPTAEVFELSRSMNLLLDISVDSVVEDIDWAEDPSSDYWQNPDGYNAP